MASREVRRFQEVGAWRLFLVLLGIAAALPAQMQPVRIQATVFGRPALLEVLDLPRDRALEALQMARDELAAIEGSFDETEGNAADQIEAAAGKGPIQVSPVLLDLIDRAWNVCLWSNGAHGPLGADLYRLWGVPDPVLQLPEPSALQNALARARCDRLAVDRERGTVELAAGTHLQLWGFSIGYAVDRAVAKLEEQGSANGRVIVGRVARGFGRGPSGRGWPIDLPEFASLDDEQAPRIYLQDESVAVVSDDDRHIEIVGKRYPPYVDQRSGYPPERMVATVTVSELAVDAQGVGVALFVMGSLKGQMHLGKLRPSPSALWIEGSRHMDPLIVQHRWSSVSRE